MGAGADTGQPTGGCHPISATRSPPRCIRSRHLRKAPGNKQGHALQPRRGWFTCIQLFHLQAAASPSPPAFPSLCLPLRRHLRSRPSVSGASRKDVTFRASVGQKRCLDAQLVMKRWPTQHSTGCSPSTWADLTFLPYFSSLRFFSLFTPRSLVLVSYLHRVPLLSIYFLSLHIYKFNSHVSLWKTLIAFIPKTSCRLADSWLDAN